MPAVMDEDLQVSSDTDFCKGKSQTKDKGNQINNTKETKPKLPERKTKKEGGERGGGSRTAQGGGQRREEREGRRREDGEGDGRKEKETGMTEKGEKGRK